MFEILLSAEAKQYIDQAVRNHGGPKAGLMIHRQGAVGDLTRTSNGNTKWEMERPHPWAIQVGEWDAIPDNNENIVFVEGVRIWLPLIPKPGEVGVIVSVAEGQLRVDSIDV